MSEPQRPFLPEGAPQDVRDFVECRADALVWREGLVNWLPLPVDPVVGFGRDPDGFMDVMVDVTVGEPPLGTSFSFFLGVNDAGELTLGTFGDLPAKDQIENWINDLNAWLRHHGKKLEPIKLEDGAIHLQKTAAAVASAGAAAPVVAAPVGGAGGADRSAGPPLAALIVGGLLLLVLAIGALAFALGGFGQTPTVVPTPTGVAGVPTPTDQPTNPPTATPVAPSPTLTASPTPEPTASPSPTITPLGSLNLELPDNPLAWSMLPTSDCLNLADHSPVQCPPDADSPIHGVVPFRVPLTDGSNVLFFAYIGEPGSFSDTMIETLVGSAGEFDVTHYIPTTGFTPFPFEPGEGPEPPPFVCVDPDSGLAILGGRAVADEDITIIGRHYYEVASGRFAVVAADNFPFNDPSNPQPIDEILAWEDWALALTFAASDGFTYELGVQSLFEQGGPFFGQQPPADHQAVCDALGRYILPGTPIDF